MNLIFKILLFCVFVDFAKQLPKKINNSPNKIIATVDLSGLTSGTHEVEIKVTSDDVRVKLIPKTSTVKIVISKR